LSNANGAEISIDAFSGLMTATARHHLDRRSPEPATTLVHVGRSEGYIERRLGDLTLIQRNRTVGAVSVVSADEKPPVGRWLAVSGMLC
jgi:hypothetical protein